MKTKMKILTAILICLPVVAWAKVDVSKMESAGDMATLNTETDAALDALLVDEYYKPLPDDYKKGIIDDARAQTTGAAAGSAASNSDNQNQDNQQQDNKQEDAAANQAKIDEAQKNLDAAKAKEQSEANKTLEALSIATMGIGAMQLAQGISEKKADAAADADMEEYIKTMRCTYAGGKSVPWGQEEIELPGGNSQDLMNYRAEYFSLAASLKERKAALDLKPGIEAEEILDKASSGLYDDENVGITGGHYASRYRAAAGSEKDQKGLAAAKKEAKNRMIAGGVIAGVGLVGSVVGNSLINGKLGELIKKNKQKKAADADNRTAITKLKNKARAAGLTDPEYIDSMGLESYNVGNYISVIDKAVLRDDLKGQKIADLCPTPQVECADKLLTPESKKDIVGEVAMGNTGVNSGAMSAVTGAAMKAGLADKAKGLLNGSGQASADTNEEAGAEASN